MRTLDDVLGLRGAELSVVAAALHADASRRERVRGYEGLVDLDVIDAPDGSRLLVRGDALALVYVGPEAMPDGVASADLVAALGSAGRTVRSRQGRAALMHIVAEQGVAWSEEDGVVGFIEVFAPTSVDDYLRDVYVEPPTFLR